jgi:transcriptional regulator with XRE-family HTH domain
METFGDALRRLRKARDMSQPGLAAAIHYSQSQISRAESGQALPPADIAQHMDRALNADGTLISLHRTAEAERRAREHAMRSSHQCASCARLAVGSGSTTTARRGTVDSDASTRADEEGEDVRRSEFLALAGGTLAGLVAPPLVHGWPTQPPPGLPALDDELLVHLRAHVEGLRWRDRQEGARRLLPATSRYAHQLAGYWQVTEEDHPLRPALGQLAADACHLAAYQAFDQGDRAQAVEWYRSSAELAARCAAPGMYVFAMCGVAYMYARAGRPDLASSVLDQLAPIATSAADHSYLAAYRAHTHASAARRDVARRALDQAAAHAEQTHNDPPSAWLGIPDSSWVQRQEVIVLSQLGDPDALPALDRLNAATSAVFQRFQVTLQANYALVHAKTGNIDEAAASLIAAATKNRSTQSMEKARVIIEARRALPAVDSSALRAADELLHEARTLTSAFWTATTR